MYFYSYQFISIYFNILLLTLDLITPGMSVEELYLSGVKLDNHDPELPPVVYKIMKIYEEKFEKKAIEQVSAMVKNKQFGQAQDLVKKVLQLSNPNENVIPYNN